MAAGGQATERCCLPGCRPPAPLPERGRSVPSAPRRPSLGPALVPRPLPRLPAAAAHASTTVRTASPTAETSCVPGTSRVVAAPAPPQRLSQSRARAPTRPADPSRAQGQTDTSLSSAERPRHPSSSAARRGTRFSSDFCISLRVFVAFCPVACCNCSKAHVLLTLRSAGRAGRVAGTRRSPAPPRRACRPQELRLPLGAALRPPPSPKAQAGVTP